MLTDKRTFLQFGPFLLDKEKRVLMRNDEIVPLAAKLLDTLLMLVENSGEVLSKGQLITSLWPETFVEESNLAQNIFHLRRALTDHIGGTQFIQTVPKRGYRFVAPVTFVDNDTYKEVQHGYQQLATEKKTQFGFQKLGLVAIFPAILFLGAAFYLSSSTQRADTASVSLRQKESLAVLRFDNIAENKEDEELIVGMTDALIAKLGNLDKIIVRPTTSVLQAKSLDPIGIGRELRVDKVLSGTFQRTGNIIRVSVQLIDVESESTVWTDQFDTTARSVFEIQDSISARVSVSLLGKLGDAETQMVAKRYTSDLRAFDAYSRGRYFLEMSSRKDLSKSIEYFQQAIKLDPQYALAYSGLADLQIFIASNYTGTPSAIENLKLAKVNALKALEIDDTLAEPHTTLAVVIFEESGDWVAAEKEFLKSIELNSNNSVAHNWYALHLLAQGDFDKAEVEMKKALEIDPVSPSMNVALGQIYYFGKQYELAIAQFEKSVELDLKFNTANIYLALSLEAIGNKEQALALLQEILNDYPKYTPAKTALGCIYADTGNQSQARRILEYLEKMKTPSVYEKYGIALINAHLGNKEKSLVMLEKISTFRNLNMTLRFKFDPRLDILRQDKRFETILGISAQIRPHTAHMELLS